MIIFPAIDLIGGKAVRLVKGDYGKMTVYDDNPLATAHKFKSAGAEYLHVVDLEGARDGGTPNFETVSALAKDSGLKVEIGGGVRSLDVIEKYLEAGVFRVIIGTSAVTDPEFLTEAVGRYGDKIAVGADVKDGVIAIKGWLEKSEIKCLDFFASLAEKGVKTVICTDISKDGLLAGTNLELYKELSSRFSMNITASGGVSSESDVKKLTEMGLYGAILGKALYTGAVDLARAVKIAGGYTV